MYFLLLPTGVRLLPTTTIYYHLQSITSHPRLMSRTGHMSHQTQETLSKRACHPFAENRSVAVRRQRTTNSSFSYLLWCKMSSLKQNQPFLSSQVNCGWLTGTLLETQVCKASNIKLLSQAMWWWSFVVDETIGGSCPLAIKDSHSDFSLKSKVQSEACTN